jgi:outer membrane receptor for ferrienterochelin and colicins
MPQIVLRASATSLAIALGQPLGAQIPTDPASTPAPTAKPLRDKRVYTAADFARFAPKTAYDMLTQVPGFTTRGADQERGLGQASENVLINGQRVANKSGGAIDQLQRTAASNVERIEIVDAASLGIAGLSGEVANVILKAAPKSSGAFEWAPNWRAHFAKAEPAAGSISYSGSKGPLDYTLSVQNNYGRGGLGGPIKIFDRNHLLTETRNEIYHSGQEAPNFEAKFGLHGPGSALANLTLGYQPYWFDQYTSDTRVIVATGERRSRTNVSATDGYVGDISGDYEFAFGPGRLKLIGLRHWTHSPQVVTQLLHFDSSGADDQGSRFSDDSRSGETIGRGEYRWKTGRNDWQVSLERAFNSLEQVGRLFELDPSHEFVEVPFPGGTGKVTELRYEAIATLSRPLAPNLDLQVAGGGEISRLDLVTDDKPARRFFRPKGSITLGWRPAPRWDVSLKLRRRVGQITFSDFLAQAVLSQDRENASNPDLVPPQSWEAETEISHDLGRWGKTRLRAWYYRVQDIVDFIPIGTDEQGVGNLPRARRAGFESVSTIQFDPIGWTGAKLDLTLGREWTAVDDPLTRRPRPISGIEDKWMTAQVRHDIPHSPWAWSAYVNFTHFARNYYLTEVYRSLDLPWIAGFYVENKNVMGTTVRFTVDNVLNGRHFVDRTVYGGYRDRTPVLFFERHNELVGPLFSVSIKGSFR